MFRWLGSLFRGRLIADVPAEMDLCLDCGKLECSEGEYLDCSRRKTHAAELDAMHRPPDDSAISPHTT
jgi:hypothetical protein